MAWFRERAHHGLGPIPPVVKGEVFDVGKRGIPEKFDAAPLTKVQLILLNISWLGLSVMYLVLSVEVVPSQVQSLVGDGMKGQVLGAMVAAGAVVTFILSPVVGMLSDRIRSRFGKRRPIMLLGTICLCLSLVGMALTAPNTESDQGSRTCHVDLELRRCLPYMDARSLENVTSSSSPQASLLRSLLKSRENRNGHLGLYTLFYLLIITFYAVISVPYNGLIADQTPSFQRGFSSGVMGAMTLSGNVLGAILGFFFPKLGVIGVYCTVAGVCAACILTTICVTTERPTHTSVSGKMDVRAVFGSFWEPLKEHDFRWVFVTRFLMQQAVATVTGFLQFWLGDMVELPDCWGPENAVAIVLLPMLLAAAVFSVVGGHLSDRLNKRKPLVVGSAFLMSISSLILAGLKGHYAFYATIPVAITFGVGFGAYSAVDFALVMDVLPPNGDHAKDLAVWHQAMVLPQCIATPIGGLVLDSFEKLNCHLGLGYIVLFVITSLYFAISGLLVVRIRRSK